MIGLSESKLDETVVNTANPLSLLTPPTLQLEITRLKNSINEWNLIYGYLSGAIKKVDFSIELQTRDEKAIEDREQRDEEARKIREQRAKKDREEREQREEKRRLAKERNVQKIKEEKEKSAGKVPSVQKEKIEKVQMTEKELLVEKEKRVKEEKEQQAVKEQLFKLEKENRIKEGKEKIVKKIEQIIQKVKELEKTKGYVDSFKIYFKALELAKKINMLTGAEKTIEAELKILRPMIRLGFLFNTGAGREAINQLLKGEISTDGILELIGMMDMLDMMPEKRKLDWSADFLKKMIGSLENKEGNTLSNDHLLKYDIAEINVEQATVAAVKVKKRIFPSFFKTPDVAKKKEVAENESQTLTPLFLIS